MQSHCMAELIGRKAYPQSRIEWIIEAGWLRDSIQLRVKDLDRPLHPPYKILSKHLVIKIHVRWICIGRAMHGDA